MYNLLKQKNQPQTTPTKKPLVFNRTPLGFKSPNALVESPVTFNRFQQQVKNDEEFARRLQNSLYEDSNQFQIASSSSSSNRPFNKPKKIMKSIQRTLDFNFPSESKIRPLDDESEFDRSAAINVQQDITYNDQNSNEFNFPQQKGTAAMKRPLISDDDDESEEFKVIWKRAKDDGTDDLVEDDTSDYASEISDEENAEIDDDFEIEECESAVRGAPMFQDTVVELKSDGRLMLDGVCRLTFTQAQMKRARDAGVDKCSLRLNADGYIWGSGSFGLLHRFFTTAHLDDDYEEFTAIGCPLSKSNYVVAHWDNILNFLDDRNKNIPALLNWWSQRGKVYQRGNGLYYCSVQVKGHRKLYTATVDSPAKALHARDVLQMRLIPKWARTYFLSLRKSQCASPELLPFYDSIESLLACSTLYQKIHRTFKRNVGERFSLINLSEASQLFKQGEQLARRDKRPLSTEDAIVRYTGSGGKIIDFVVLMEHYLTLIQHFNGHFHSTKGQIQLDNDTLARLVMGLHWDTYLLEVLHSPSGKRWNRPQDLRTGTRSDNIREILRTNSHGLGVQKHNSKYRAKIRIMSPGLFSTVFTSKEAAAAIYKALVQNLPHFVRQFKAEGVFDTGKEFQAIRQRIVHAFVNEYRRSPVFLALFTFKGAIRS